MLTNKFTYLLNIQLRCETPWGEFTLSQKFNGKRVIFSTNGAHTIGCPYAEKSI